MFDKYFCDTNILIYLFSTDCPEKRKTVEGILQAVGEVCISIQVVNECVRVLHERKNKSYQETAKVIKELSEIFFIGSISLDTVEHGLYIAHTYRYAYFDSLILSSALEMNCCAILTEDMQHDQIIEKKLKILNPFK